MSSLLRSTKCLRYFTGAARSLVLNAGRSFDSGSLCNINHLSAATGWMREYSGRRRERLEPLLARLDAEVRRYGRITRRDVDDLLQEVRAHDVTSAQSLLIIRCCGELVPEEPPERRTQLVQRIWSVLSERGVPMDISHYNALLRVYLENEHAFSPAEFLDDLERKGLQPNRVTYQRLMWRYCQAGDVEGATRVLEKMRELALPVSEPVLNALVMGHAFHGDTEGARTVLQTMAGAGLQPSNRTYALLACGHARQGDVEGVKSILQLAAEQDVLMADKDLMDVVEALALGGHGDSADLILQMMHRGSGYNQDALHLILKLINRGHDDIAEKVLRTMNKGTSLEGSNALESVYRGAFFVKQLLRTSRPPNSIIDTCRRLQDEGLVPCAMSIATETALQQGNVHLARLLFQQLKRDGTEIRQHYYWPLLAASGKAGDEEALLDVLRSMIADELLPSGETLRDYVIPFLRNKYSPETMVLKLQGANVTAVHAARNVVLVLLDSKEMKEAAKLVTQYRLWGYASMLARPLIASLRETKDVESFVDILHVAASGPLAIEDDPESPESKKDEKNKNDVDYIVFGAVKALKEAEPVDKLLTLLLERGIGIGNKTAENIQEHLGENMNTALSDKLSRLTSPELEVLPVQRVAVSTPRNAQQLESLLTRAKERGTNTATINRQLITAYVNAGDGAKLTALLNRLETEQFVLTGATLALVIEFYSQSDDVEKALHYKRLLSEREPDFPLNRFKVMRLALALVKAARVDEAVELLSSHVPAGETEAQSFRYNSICWQVLNHLAEQKDQEGTRRLLDTMLESKYVEPSNSLLGPLIKAHLLQDDVAGAVREFERCCHTYRCTPWKAELTRQLIAAEDAARLQQVTDLSTAVHGEVNSLHDLVLAFVECGRLRQARRILETPGLRSRGARLTQACQRYQQEGKTECLEGLLEATKELSHIDRSNIFYHLLVSYCGADLTEKALGLWTLLQEEGETPSEPFLLHLGKHLQDKNLDVPFIMPSEDVPLKQSKPTKTKVDKREERIETNVTERGSLNTKVGGAVAAGDLDAAIKLIEPTVQNEITRKTYSELVEQLVQHGREADGVRVVEQAADKKTYLEPKILRYLLKKLAEKGEKELIERVGALLNERRQREVSLHNKLTQAEFTRGAGAAHVRKVMSDITAAADDASFTAAIQNFPKSTSLAEAIKDDHTHQLCKKIVEIAAEKGNVAPANALWMEYLLDDRPSDADAVWDKYLHDANSLMFRRILQHSYVSRQPALVEKLISYLEKNDKITPAARGNAYSRLVSVALDDAGTAAALQQLQRALRHVRIEHINRNVLARLEAKLAEEGKSFEYTVPPATPRSR